MLDEFMKTLSPEQKKKLIASLSEGLDEPVAEAPAQVPVHLEPRRDIVVPPPEHVAVNDDFTVNRQPHENKSRTTVKAGKNTWVDPETEHLDVETPALAKKASKRPPAQIIDVPCSACGTICKVNKDIVFGKFHRCDRCIGGG